MLAVASRGVIIGFNSRPDTGAKRLAEAEKVEIKQYSIIYNLIEDLQKAIQGMLEPVYADVVDGHAEVRQIFRISRQGNVAGCYVTDGTIHRNDLVKVMRNGQMIADVRCGGLKRFQDDVREVANNLECGVSLDGTNDIEVGDILEFYHKERTN
jgi:translation initiation factor IF-2